MQIITSLPPCETVGVVLFVKSNSCDTFSFYVIRLFIYCNLSFGRFPVMSTPGGLWHHVNTCGCFCIRLFFLLKFCILLLLHQSCEKEMSFVNLYL